MLTSLKCDISEGYKYRALDFPEIYDTVQSRQGTAINARYGTVRVFAISPILKEKMGMV